MKNRDKRIVVLGKGYLGTEFERQGYEVWDRLDFDFNITDVQKFPIEFYKALEDCFHDFDIIVNCVGVSDTRWCEDNFSEALDINGLLPWYLSTFCNRTNKQLVHISTGCLYDVPNIPQKENSFIGAHCNYTVSKWVGEKGLRPERDLILRPRLFFSDVKNPKNLLCKLPKFSKYVDVHNSCTDITEIPKAAQALIGSEQVGIFNVACDGALTMWDIAQLLQLDGEPMSGDDLVNQENVFLVNNVMNITKLKQFYQPQTLREAVLRCWESINI